MLLKRRKDRWTVWIDIQGRCIRWELRQRVWCPLQLEIVEAREGRPDPEAFAGDGVFRDRLTRVEETYSGDPLIGGILAFIRGGTRPLITETARIGKDAGEDA